jgi:hypothetical protein
MAQKEFPSHQPHPGFALRLKFFISFWSGDAGSYRLAVPGLTISVLLASWVEQDASVILETVLHTMSEALDKAGLSKSSVRAVGLTNQRETTVVWDRHTGKALHPAIGM